MAARNRRPASRTRLLALAGAWAFAFFPGCASTVTPPPPPPPEAQLVITNLTPHRWRIVIRRPDEAIARTAQIPPHGGVTLALAPGEYGIEQAIEGAGEAATRRFRARFVAGEYAWSLATARTVEPPSVSAAAAP